MKIEFQPLTEKHKFAVIDIFNYFIKNSYAAYPEEPVHYEFFTLFQQIAQRFPAIAIVDMEQGDDVVGFAFMRPFHQSKTFRRTAELSYFLLPEYTRKGIGGKDRNVPGGRGAKNWHRLFAGGNIIVKRTKSQFSP